jgi:hypothetical protein
MKRTQAATNSPELAAYKEAAKASVNTWLTEWCLLFKAAYVSRVRMSYSGGSDDGQIDEVTFAKLVDGKHEDFEPEIMKATLEKFEEFLYELITARGADFNNDGCQGYLTWDIEADTLEHNHGTNYTSVEENEYEGCDDLIDSIEAGR